MREKCLAVQINNHAKGPSSALVLSGCILATYVPLRSEWSESASWLVIRFVHFKVKNMSSAIILLYLYRDRLSYISLPPLQLEAEITAVIATAKRFGAVPDKLRMQIIIGNIVTVAKTMT